MFILEALRARHGDCLLLRWGDAKDGHVALIDGGPLHTYEDALRPRLVELAKERALNRIPLDLVIVSHVDDDHIKGILMLADEAVNGNGSPADIRRIWHNSLELLLDDAIPTNAASTTASLSSEAASEALASVSQGRALDSYIVQLGLGGTLNHPFRPLVAAGGSTGPVPIKGLTLTVVAPRLQDLEALRLEWRKHRRLEPSTASYADTSVFNHSSMVVLAGFGGRRMLLTGDARGDLVLEGLGKAGLLTAGRLHVDLLKVPHHASPNNLTRAFFEAVTADVYVVSGNKTTNAPALQWLAEARGKADYTVACTYDLPHARAIFGERMRVPCDGSNAVVVDLSACPE